MTDLAPAQSVFLPSPARVQREPRQIRAWTLLLVIAHLAGSLLLTGAGVLLARAVLAR